MYRKRTGSGVRCDGVAGTDGKASGMTAKQKIKQSIVRKQAWLLHHACPRFWQELFEDWTE